MEMNQILVCVGDKPEQIQAISKVLESKQINTSVIDWGYDPFYGCAHIVLSRSDEVMQALQEAGFGVICSDRHESVAFKSNHAEAMAICA